ncbi:MAG: superoxide reductase [Candidatus Omnitrophica bacterium]|nr:superoxide reductase [Candidatus Omnitrophota bacterium]
MAGKWKCEKDILCGVNEPKDRENLEDLEKKHMPLIEAPDKVKKDEPFEVGITVGGIDGVDHPNEAGHFIEWVELYSGDTFLGRASYSGGASLPRAVFRVKLDHAHGPLKVWEKCNLHGLWENTKEITVE